MSLLVIITGPPCSGKTTLGKRLSDEAALPFFYKDRFKEMMYDLVIERDGLGSIELVMSRLLGAISIKALEVVIEEMIAKGESLVVEANFDSTLFSPFINEMQREYDLRLLQIQLKAEGHTLKERFIRRESEGRHPGHQGLKYLAEMETQFTDEQRPLLIDGDLVVVDTTDVATIPYRELLRQLLSARDFLDQP